METGKENWRGGCNAAGTPTEEGEIKRFRSPFDPSVILTDIAERDRYGNLKWVAYTEGQENDY